MKAAKNKVNKKDKNIDKLLEKEGEGWESAIRDAELLLVQEKARVRAINDAIRAFKNLRDSKAPFPGERAPA